MKKNAAVIISDANAINYFCRLSPVQAKKVLFEMSLLKGDQRLGDSNLAEARKIAGFYDGVITAGYANGLTGILVNEYTKAHPGTLLTKKQVEAHTDARYRKLYEAVGLYGFDYVVTALKLGKMYVANPANGIDEKHMLNALRWDERREGLDVAVSNDRHRRKGIQLVGLGDMMEPLLPYTFIIASVYELLIPDEQNVPAAEYAEESTSSEDIQETKADMVAVFIENAHLLKDFYGTSKPEVPEGFFAEDLYEGSHDHALAKKGMFLDSEAVLKYVDGIKMYESCQKRISEIFTEAEIQVITEKAEVLKEILRLVDSL